MKYAFYAMLSRMKNISRWSLMHNTRKENICEHSHEVAVLAHALALLQNRLFDGSVNVEQCVLISLYHDATEILTGDMPTPVKYDNPAIRDAYKQVEDIAANKLLSLLPPELESEYHSLLLPENSEEQRIVKAADKLSGLIKCVEELKQGNKEFSKARKATEKSLREMKLEAADYFLSNCLPAYELTLDEL